MFKDKTFGAAPFLQLSDGKEDVIREEGEMAFDSRDALIEAENVMVEFEIESARLEPAKEEGASDISTIEGDILFLCPPFRFLLFFASWGRMLPRQSSLDLRVVRCPACSEVTS